MSDYAQEAKNIIKAVFDYAETDGNTEAITNMLGAQVHATLAVAEQLRIANLIALWSTEDVQPSIAHEVWPTIAASLGLAVGE